MKAENIKFKAKRLDNNTWVEGYFYAECGNTYIIEDRQSESMLNRNEAHQVDPSTVCQFTGLKDCEGNEIWELFDTEQEALIALFEKFKEKVKRKVDFFSKEAKRLGIKQQLLLQ